MPLAMLSLISLKDIAAILLFPENSVKQKQLLIKCQRARYYKI